MAWKQHQAQEACGLRAGPADAEFVEAVGDWFVLLPEPGFGGCGAGQEPAFGLAGAEGPGFDVFGELFVPPGLGEFDACPCGGCERHALVELALVAGAQQLAENEVVADRDFGLNLADVGVDVGVTVRLCDRNAMVAVDDEMQLAHAEDVDRRHRASASAGRGDALPPSSGPRRGGAEPAVELGVPAIDGADDGVERDGLQPQMPFAVRPSAATTSLKGSMKVTSSRRRTREASFVMA